jgi:hypothetical protein
MATIKDSGERTKFDSGAVRDMHEGKGRMDLLPWAAIMEVSKHCEAGAKKYGEHNVDRGIPTSSLCDSGMRHLAKYLDGWTDEPHLLAACWNLLWALEMVVKHPECVNTPWKVKNENDVNFAEIIHCKDCRWFNNAGCAIKISDDADKPIECDFCSFAERKDNEQT